MRHLLDLITESQLLIERTEKVPYRDYMGQEQELLLVWNPNVQQVKTLIDRSVEKQIRVLVVGREIVTWDAYYVEHAEVERLLGLPRQGRDHKLFIGLDGDHYRFMMGSWYLYRDQLLEVPAIKRLLDRGIDEPPRKNI